MPYFQRNDVEVADVEGFGIDDFVHRQVRRAGVGMFRKAVEEVLTYAFRHIGGSTDLYTLQCRERPQVVESAHMVVVLVGDEHRVDEWQPVVVGACAAFRRFPDIAVGVW